MRLRLSEHAAKVLRQNPEEAKAQHDAKTTALLAKHATERQARDQRNAEREAVKAREKAKRARAEAGDRSLAEALDRLDEVVAEQNGKQTRLGRLAGAAEDIRARINALETQLAEARARLAEIERELESPTLESQTDAEAKVRDAWREHVMAWSLLPAAYVKKHRNRSLRRRVREYKLESAAEPVGEAG